jgi:hypothetical protein
VCLCGKRAGIEEEKRREDLWLRLQVDRLLAKGNCRYLAKPFSYHHAGKNRRYDLTPKAFVGRKISGTTERKKP